jgi:hypothetical protein
MESKTLAVFDSTLWFIRVGVAAALFVGAMSGTANGRTDLLHPQLNEHSNLKVQLVKTLPNRRSRKLEFGVENVCAVGN